MTIFESQELAAKKLGATHIASTTIWNHHNATIQSNRTQAYKLATSLIEKGEAKYVIGLIGRKGRSPHSATDVHLFSFDKFNDEAFADLTTHSNSTDYMVWYK